MKNIFENLKRKNKEADLYIGIYMCESRRAMIPWKDIIKILWLLGNYRAETEKEAFDFAINNGYNWHPYHSDDMDPYILLWHHEKKLAVEFCLNEYENISREEAEKLVDQAEKQIENGEWQ